jgi:hypothetical protein
MPHSRYRLHFEADADSDALLRVLAFALSLSLAPRRILAERKDDCLRAEIRFDTLSERSAQLLTGKAAAIVSVRRAWLVGRGVRAAAADCARTADCPPARAPARSRAG